VVGGGEVLVRGQIIRAREVSLLLPLPRGNHGYSRCAPLACDVHPSADARDVLRKPLAAHVVIYVYRVAFAVGIAHARVTRIRTFGARGPRAPTAAVVVNAVDNVTAASHVHEVVPFAKHARRPEITTRSVYIISYTSRWSCYIRRAFWLFSLPPPTEIRLSFLPLPSVPNRRRPLLKLFIRVPGN